MSLRDDLAAILRGLCPESCPRCGDESPAGFCTGCHDDFARIVRPCRACGLPKAGHQCPAAESWWQIDRVRAPYRYQAPLSHYLQRLKYAGDWRLGAALGKLLVATITGAAGGNGDGNGGGAGSGGMPALIVPVPLHPSRLRERRFNQADEIARPLAAAVGARLSARGIRRQRATQSQTGLSRENRLRALADAFAVRGRLDGCHIAVIDDVLTTGATVNALARALKLAGAGRVEAWAVARAPGDDTGAEPGPGGGSDQATRNR